MANQRLSSRYANSLLSLAKDANSVDAIFNDMQSIEETISTSDDLASMLNSPIISSTIKTNVLTKVFSKNVKELTSNFLKLLISKGRENYLQEICKSFIAEYNEINKIADVTLVTAIPATDKIVKEVSDFLTKSESYSKVSITQEVDPTIIGGFILKMGDKLLDNSIQRKLQKIRKELV